MVTGGSSLPIASYYEDRDINSQQSGRVNGLRNFSMAAA